MLTGHRVFFYSSSNKLLIGLLSDTHIPEAGKELPAELKGAFQSVDLILHAGDIYIPRVLDELETIAPVLAARGDDDFGDVVKDRRVQSKHVLRLEEHTLWLIHEEWYILLPYQQGNIFSGQYPEHPPDIIVFGHKHRASVEHMDGVLLVNPGSPTFLDYRRGLGTVAILDLHPGEADVRIVQL